MAEEEYKGTVYDSPEAHGLDLIFEKDSGASYEFDIIAVWRHKETNKLYVGQDSGCSCPSPFEDFHTIDSLEEVNPHNIQNLVDLMREAGVSLLDLCELIEESHELQDKKKETENERRASVE